MSGGNCQRSTRGSREESKRGSRPTAWKGSAYCDAKADRTHTALVRWPPMGRKKDVLDGALRGRNELIQGSIRRHGYNSRPQAVSSHLQVLKQHLHNQPGGKYKTPPPTCISPSPHRKTSEPQRKFAWRLVSTGDTFVAQPVKGYVKELC